MGEKKFTLRPGLSWDNVHRCSSPSWALVPNRGGSVEDDGPWLSKLARVDFLGGLLLGSAILVFLLPLELAGTIIPWAHPLIYGLFAASVALGLLYIFVEISWAKEPILSPRLLMSKNILIPNTVTFCQTAAQLGVRKALFAHDTPAALCSDSSADDVHHPDILPSDSKYLSYDGRRSSSAGGCGRDCGGTSRGIFDLEVSSGNWS